MGSENLPPEEWTTRLAAAMAAAVVEFARQVRGSRFVLVAVDCHPWHGTIHLAALTEAEAAADPLLADPAEMAAWTHFRFTSTLGSWRHAEGLAREMRAAYDAAADKREVAEAFLRACARAAASMEFTDAVQFLDKGDTFRLSVPHPDDGREFFRTGA